MQSCKSWRPSSFWHKEEDEEVASSEAFNLQRCSLTSSTTGCGFEGKLFERMWKDFFEFTEKESIFFTKA
ncbi:hypothetical protein IC582_001337 [Cucumis melo]